MKLSTQFRNQRESKEKEGSIPDDIAIALRHLRAMYGIRDQEAEANAQCPGQKQDATVPQSERVRF